MQVSSRNRLMKHSHFEPDERVYSRAQTHKAHPILKVSSLSSFADVEGLGVKHENIRLVMLLRLRCAPGLCSSASWAVAVLGCVPGDGLGALPSSCTHGERQFSVTTAEGRSL